MKTKNAFSLLELSIVLIIVGLLSIITFRSAAILDNSKLKKISTEVQHQKDAYHTFKIIYNNIPGDLSNAYDLWGNNCNSDANICNGNGDGLITVNEGSDSDETYMSLRHLYLANLLSSNYSGQNSSGQVAGENVIASFLAPHIAYLPPMNGDGSVYKYAKFSNQAVIALGRISTQSPAKFTFPFLTPKHAGLYDNKYDDSLPWFGDVRVHIRSGSDYNSTPPQTDCISGVTGISSEKYNVNNKRKVCSFVFLLE
jgi:prepilin-type N-terminal cleavage/methylation domain-containing protein